jgi:hypothetical protein
LRLRAVTQPSYPDDVVVELTVINKSFNTIGICRHNTPFNFGEYSPRMFEVKNSEGELLEYQHERDNTGDDYSCREEGDFLIIPRKPRFPIRGYINLADTYDFSPGKYTVRLIDHLYLPNSNEIEVVVEEKESDSHRE